MAKRLSGPLAACVLAAALPAAGRGALAQGVLADPTRPPSALPGSATGEAPATGEASATPSRLQSVLISRDRRVAVIDGRAVSLGEKVNDATLVQVAETHVTLRKGESLTTLELAPGIARQPIQPARKPENKKGKRP